MSAQHETVHPLVRKLSTATCLVALLPIGMGALVTTLKAGMAFSDWPSSDGQNMFLYPWFSDFASDPDKFVEHGHRLAGMLIGLVSVMLTVAGWMHGARWVRVFVSLILMAVIVQGLLGGARVILDEQLLAMIHSITGALYFSLCVVFRLACAGGWPRWCSTPENRFTPVAAAIVIAAPIAITCQYVLGGMLRHLHMMLNEHLLGAVIAGVISATAAFWLMRSEHSLLRRCGLAMCVAICLQFVLGAGSYVTRFGLPTIGYVATAGSLSQAIVCSLHTVFGMFLLASAVVSAVCVVRLILAGCLNGLSLSMPPMTERGTVA